MEGSVETARGWRTGPDERDATDYYGLQPGYRLSMGKRDRPVDHFES